VPLDVARLISAQPTSPSQMLGVTKRIGRAERNHDMILFAILLMGAIVFILRFSFFAIPSDRAAPMFVQRALPYVFPAVLAALLVPGILLADDGSLRAPVYNPYLVGVATGFVVGAFKKDSFFLVFGSSVLGFVVAKLLFSP
jgi:branched-subunit amino acid transport protein